MSHKNDEPNSAIIINAEDCKLCQPKIDAVRSLCLDNGMKLYVGKTPLYFYRKTNTIAFKHEIGFTHINSFLYVKGFEVILNYKLYFHRHIDHGAAQVLNVRSRLLHYVSLSTITTPLFCIVPL